MNSLVQVRRILVIAVVLAVAAFAASKAEDIEWELDDTFSVEDRAAILSLCEQMGMEQPRRISLQRIRPTHCRFVLVDSRVEDVGNHRTWFQLRIRPRDWSDCILTPTDSTWKSAGRWVTLSSALEKREQWRIRDDPWYVDVHLGADVSYTKAEFIFLAIHRGRMKVVGPCPNCPLNSVGLVDSIASIRRDTDRIDRYWIYTGTHEGSVLEVGVVDGGVELHSYGEWIP